MNQLAYNNNWNNDEYYVNGKAVKALTLVEIGDDYFPVMARKVSVAYDDMGHTYTATSTHYFVKTSVFGTIMEFDLNTIVNKVTVNAVNWE